MPPAISPFPDRFDSLSKHGAGLIAEHIVRVWAARGFAVRAERYQIPDYDAWGVRSSLVNGLPSRTRRAQ